MGLTKRDAEARFDFRIAASQKRTIEHAAELMGMSASQFAKTTLLIRAKEVVGQHGMTVLSDRDRDQFIALLDADEAPNGALRRAAARHRQRKAG